MGKMTTFHDLADSDIPEQIQAAQNMEELKTIQNILEILQQTLEGFPEAFREALTEAEREAKDARLEGRRQIESLLQIQRSSLDQMAAKAVEVPLASLQAQADRLDKAIRTLDSLPARTQAQADWLESVAARVTAMRIPGFWGLAGLTMLSGIVSGAITALALLSLTGGLGSKSQSLIQPQAQELSPAPADHSLTQKSGRHGK
jgi:hypothetical protein